MIHLWIDRDHMRLRKYGVSGTGTKTLVKIEIEVTDPTELGFFLRELAEAQAKVATDRPKRTTKQEKQHAVEHRKPLALPFYGSGDE